MPEPKRDRYGRYLLTHPDTGEELAWTRVTKFAEAIEGSYNLTKWKQRAVAVGIGLRPDLLGLAQSLDLDDDKKELDNVCYKAQNAAQADRRSNLGTALHKFTQRIDMGERPRIPAAYADEIDAYRELKRKHGILTRPDLIERITVIPEWQLAGTFDRIIRMNGKTYIADLKTGNEVEPGLGKIEIQLACYAHGVALWDAKRGAYDPMPTVDQTTGYVIHVPAGDPGRAAVYPVDLVDGWDGASLCAEVRGWRKQKTLSQAIS
jgi:hypothetical protein